MTDTADRRRGSERRYASILFADIAGFTAMSELLDPEDVTATMNECFGLLEGIVRAHGGHVDKYIGDCVMAVFGVPHGLEDAPKHAVNAAIEIRNRIGELPGAHDPQTPLRVHIGVNSGLVVAGDVGGVSKREFTVMGDTVNVASRLKDAAPIGSIWVGEETHRRTRDEFDYKPLRPLALKGKGEPVAAFELRSPKGHLHRPRVARANRTIASGLVGRQEEVAQLRSAIAEVVEGKGGVVNLVGEAGMGKSRLVAEVTTADGAPAIGTALVLEGRALSMGQGLSFYPFVDLLRGWASITDDDAEDAARVKLEAAIHELAPADGDELIPFVATLMGMRLSGAHAQRIEGIEGEALEKVIVKSMRELLLRLAATRPLVLVFEDLHWADVSSVRLLEVLFRTAAKTRVLFVNVFRAQHEGVGTRLLEATQESCAGRTTVIALERLNDRECDLLMRNLLNLEEVPQALRTMIRQQADGNPFFIEEVIRSLIDDGVIEYRDGRFRVTEQISSVVIPKTIQDVVMARVDRLGERERQLLRVASVIGRSFYRRILTDLAGHYDELDADLDTLKDRQLIFERQNRATSVHRRRAFVAEIEYVFKHALAQETVYHSLLNKTRKELHLQVARSIEHHFADHLNDFYGMLAYHYSRADSLEKAEEYLFKAGDEAARSAASSEALAYFQEASRLYLQLHGDGGDPARKAALEKNIGFALMNRGNLSQCIPHFDLALEAFGERFPKTRTGVYLQFAADFSAVLARLYLPGWAFRGGRVRPHDLDVLQIRNARAFAQATSDPQRFFIDAIAGLRRLNRTETSSVPEACGIYAAGAAMFAFSGVSFDIGRRFLDVARERIAPQQAGRDLFVCQAMEFIHSYLQGRWQEKYQIADELVEAGLRYGRLWDVTAYLGFCCSLSARRGEFATCRTFLEKITEINEVFAFEFGESHVYSQTAILLLEERRLHDALEAIKVYYESREEEVLNTLALGMRAKTQLLLGDRESAVATLKETADVMARAGRVPPWHQSAYVLSRLRLDLLNLAAAGTSPERRPRTLRREAATSLKTVLRVAASVGEMRPEAFRLAGRLRWLVGEPKPAFGWWSRSIAEAKRLGARPELARTYREVAAALLENDGDAAQLDGMDAQGYVDAAQDLFAAMGLAWDRERLEAIGRRAAA
jgi:class 3 adenylate cyclase/tetratricopeptide (TPR) repeat protein